MKKTYIGGQAVIEGVMMRGKTMYAMAVRDSAGQINVKKSSINSKSRPSILKLPLVRGVVAFIDSMFLGLEIINSSVEMAGLDDFEEEPSKFEKYLINKFGEKLNNIIVGFSIAIALILSISLFMVLPTFLAGFISPYMETKTYLIGFVEGIIRLLIFLAYILLMSKNKDVQRIFKYHGAEHKTINCFEKELPLTVENVRNSSRFHNRCGTSFLVFIILITMIFFMIVRTDVIYYRILSRILFIPLIAGISYEILKWAGSSNSILVKIISYPGVLFQKITTSEPDDDQIEVAILAMTTVLKKEAPDDIIPVNVDWFLWGESHMKVQEALSFGKKYLKNNILSYDIDAKLLLMDILDIDKINLLTSRDEISNKNFNLYKDYLDRRLKNEPVAYILGYVYFMDFKFLVNPSVLIPRGDTEILIYKVLDLIKDNNFKNHLDIGVGSGCIPISINLLSDIKSSIGVDISQEALNVCNTNISRFKLDDKITTIYSDLFSNVPSTKFDIITSNPPYISYDEYMELMIDVVDFEPKLALYGGKDGLDFYRKISEKAYNQLNNGGYLLYEIGYNQGKDVKKIMEDCKFSSIEILYDLNNNNRVVLGRKI